MEDAHLKELCFDMGPSGTADPWRYSHWCLSASTARPGHAGRQPHPLHTKLGLSPPTARPAGGWPLALGRPLALGAFCLSVESAGQPRVDTAEGSRSPEGTEGPAEGFPPVHREGETDGWWQRGILRAHPRQKGGEKNK